MSSDEHVHTPACDPKFSYADAKKMAEEYEARNRVEDDEDEVVEG